MAVDPSSLLTHFRVLQECATHDNRETRENCTRYVPVLDEELTEEEVLITVAEKGHSIAICAQWNSAMEQCCNGSLQWKFVMRSIMRTCTHNNYAKSRTHPEASNYTSGNYYETSKCRTFV